MVQNLKDYVLISYKMMKARRDYIVGKEQGKAGTLKKNLILRLTDRNFDLIVQAMNKFKEFVIYEKEKEERTAKNKQQVIMRLTNKGYNEMHQGLRTLKLNRLSEQKKHEIAIMKQKGIIKRMSDSNVRK